MGETCGTSGQCVSFSFFLNNWCRECFAACLSSFALLSFFGMGKRHPLATGCGAIVISFLLGLVEGIFCFRSYVTTNHGTSFDVDYKYGPYGRGRRFESAKPVKVCLTSPPSPCEKEATTSATHRGNGQTTANLKRLRLRRIWREPLNLRLEESSGPQKYEIVVIASNYWSSCPGVGIESLGVPWN